MTARNEWVIKMRRAFSPPDMLLPDGSVNQDFFKPKHVVLVNDRRWGQAEKEALLQGLEKHGVGSWQEIRDGMLPGWEDQQLRIRTSRLLGSQSLARYVGWKGDKQAVEAEHTANHQIGMQTGCWKGGLLVEDDQGSLAKFLQRQHEAQEQQGAQQQEGADDVQMSDQHLP